MSFFGITTVVVAVVDVVDKQRALEPTTRPISAADRDAKSADGPITDS